MGTHEPPRDPRVDRELAPRDRSSAWLFAAIVAASVEPVLVKVGYRAHATPWQLLVVKNLVAAAVIVPLTRRLPWIGVAGVLRVARVSVLLLCTNALSLLALTRIPAVTQMTVVAVTPALVALVSERRGRVALGGRFWVGFALCFAGLLLTIDALRPGALRADAAGLAFALGAVVSSTVYRTTLEDLTPILPPPVVSTWAFLINAALALTLIAPWAGLPARTAWAVGGWIGLAGAVANVAFIEALHRTGAARLSVFTLLQRPLVMVVAAVALHEPMRALQVVGVAAVLAGVRLAQPVKKIKRDAPLDGAGRGV